MREFKISISVKPKLYVILFSVLVLIAGCGALLLKTEAGRGMVAALVAYSFEKKTGFEFDISGLEIDVSELKASARMVALKDRNGIWLRAENVSMNWDWNNLIGIDCSMKSFDSGPVTMSTVPERSYRILNNLQNALATSPLSIDRLRIPSIIVKSQVLGRELKIGVSGSCDAVGHNRKYFIKGLNEKLNGSLVLQDLRDVREQIVASVGPEGEEPPTINASGRFSEDAGGVIGEFLGLSGSSPLAIEAIVPFRYRGTKNAVVRLETSVYSQLSFSGYVDGEGYVDYSGEIYVEDDLKIHDFVIPGKERYTFGIEFRPNKNWTELDKIGAYLATSDKRDEAFFSGGIALWKSRYDLDFKGNLPLSSPLWQGKTNNLKSDRRTLVTGSVKGAFDNPEIDLGVTAYDTSFGRYRVRKAEIATTLKGYFDSHPGLGISATASLKGLESTEPGSEKTKALEEVNASLSATKAKYGKGEWDIDAFSFGMGEYSLNLKGRYDEQQQRLVASHSMKLGELPEPVSGRFGFAAPLTVEGRIDTRWNSAGLDGSLEVMFPGKNSFPRFIGDTPKLDVRLAYENSAGQLDISAARFIGAGVEGVASGELLLNSGKMMMSGEFFQRDMAPDQSAIPVYLAGRFDLDGTLQAMTLRGKANGRAVIAEGGGPTADVHYGIGATGSLRRMNGMVTALYLRQGEQVKRSSPVSLGIPYLDIADQDALPMLKYLQPDPMEADK